MFEQQQAEHRKSRQDGVTNTKSRHLIVMNQLKKKEENWNNRFYVQNQNKNESQEKQKQKPLNIFSKLLEVQDYHNIPEFHRQLFLMCLQTLPKQTQAIQFEIEEMQQKKSHIQLCMQAVDSREKCLNQLLNHTELLQENPLDEQLISKSAELITHLRILSINVVEQIIGWRQYLMKFLVNIHSQESISLPYMFLRENYLIKMKRDISELYKSILSNYYQFSKQSDPFFVAITKPADDSSKIVQFISKPLLKRIKNCEIIIQEETVSYQKDNKSVYNQMNSKDQIKLSPEKVIPPGKLRPPKRQEQSQNYKRPFVKQLDPTDFTNQNQSSNSKQLPPSQKKDPPVSRPEPALPQQIPQPQFQPQPQPQQNPQTIPRPLSKQQSNRVTEDDNEPKIKKCQLQDSIVQDYLSKINEDFRKSWRSESDLMKQQYESQEDSFCLGIFQKKQLLAFGQCFMDTSLQERRLMLSHFSTADETQFQELLKQMLKFIWEIDPCQEVRMSLYHYNQNDQFQANKELTTKLKEIGFKWKVVQSVNSEIRFTVMAIRRPQDVTAPKQFDPLFFQHILFTSGDCPINTKNQFYSINCLSSLNTKVELEDEQISGLKDNIVNQQYQFKGIKLQEQTKEDFQSYLNEFFEDIKTINPFKDISQLPEQITSSFSKECYRWAKCRLAQKDRLLYNNFQVEQKMDNAKAFMSDSGDIKVFLISTDQSSSSIFIFEYHEDISIQKIQQILNQCGIQVPIDQNLYIPQFIVSECYKQQNNICGIGRFSTAYKPKMVDINPVNDTGYIIKPPFVFGILNEDFNEITGMPTLFFKVEDQHCLQL